MDKELRKVVKAAEKRGWKLVSGGKHYKLVHSSGRKMAMSISPSDRCAHRQVERQLARVEREIAEAA